MTMRDTPIESLLCLSQFSLQERSLKCCFSALPCLPATERVDADPPDRALMTVTDNARALDGRKIRSGLTSSTRRRNSSVSLKAADHGTASNCSNPRTPHCQRTVNGWTKDRHIDHPCTLRGSFANEPPSTHGQCHAQSFVKGAAA
jgi:hypothetical protein